MNDDLDLKNALQLIATQLGQAVARPATTPTFSEYIAELRTALPNATVKSYESYWRRVEVAWGDRCLDAPTTTEINRFVEDHRRHAIIRSNSRQGRGAAANMVSAIRCIYRHAEHDGLISSIHNPARNTRKPPQQPSPRHALTTEQVVAIGHVAATTGDDTELDALIVRIHIEAACRRGAALALTVSDLDPDDCLIRLHEKGDRVRWHPISPQLMNKLIQHIDTRGGPAATEKLLRYRNGRPITARRYDYLTQRVKQHLAWAQRLQVSIHWVRHTTLTYVEREFGEAVARAYAGHAEIHSTTATPIYTKASLIEIAEALVALTGQPHPLARAVRHPLAPRYPNR
ncbi:tyrosine-type recombinase/integrase [Nocardia araoensis]|uniref:tyrosine-type recombinase/integrase n=1 Tax=Nocardia araoensis TaxID=228600 RepID=UPI0002D6AB7A|nr:site-specific integrase [Nocardia araoensis]